MTDIVGAHDFLAQRAWLALRAMSRRRSGVNAFARALPPRLVILRNAALTAAATARLFMLASIHVSERSVKWVRPWRRA